MFEPNVDDDLGNVDADTDSEVDYGLDEGLLQ